jgi:hypothetical protein
MPEQSPSTMARFRHRVPEFGRGITSHLWQAELPTSPACSRIQPLGRERAMLSRGLPACNSRTTISAPNAPRRDAIDSGRAAFTPHSIPGKVRCLRLLIALDSHYDEPIRGVRGDFRQAWIKKGLSPDDSLQLRCL